MPPFKHGVRSTTMRNIDAVSENTFGKAMVPFYPSPPLISVPLIILYSFSCSKNLHIVQNRLISL